MLSAISHVARLAHAAFVLAREGVFTGVDLRTLPVEARAPLALAQLLARRRLAEQPNRLAVAIGRLRFKEDKVKR